MNYLMNYLMKYFGAIFCLGFGVNAVAQNMGCDSTCFAPAVTSGYVKQIPKATTTTTSFKVAYPQARSCALPWGGSITSGNSVVAYLASSSTTSCSSQTRSCTDGVLSGTYQYGSCYVTSTSGGGSSSTTPWYKIAGNARTYSFKVDGDYASNTGSLTISTAGTYSGKYRQEWCSYQGQVLEHSGTQCKYNGAWYPETTAGVTVSKVDYNFLGSVGDTGQLSGTWSTVGGGASGSMSGSPSGTTILGNNANASGAITTWTAK